MEISMLFLSRDVLFVEWLKWAFRTWCSHCIKKIVFSEEIFFSLPFFLALTSVSTLQPQSFYGNCHPASDISRVSPMCSVLFAALTQSLLTQLLPQPDTVFAM